MTAEKARTMLLEEDRRQDHVDETKCLTALRARFGNS